MQDIDTFLSGESEKRRPCAQGQSRPPFQSQPARGGPGHGQRIVRIFVRTCCAKDRVEAVLAQAVGERYREALRAAYPNAIEQGHHA
jgi:hypothetical protein